MFRLPPIPQSSSIRADSRKNHILPVSIGGLYGLIHI